MKIKVGSVNQVKVNAVKEVIADYDFLQNGEVVGLGIKSEVSDQPMTLDETITGSINRAKNAYSDCDLSFGIEDGLMKVPHTKTGYMNICACTIYDGKKFHTGLSSAFEYPIEVTKTILEQKVEVNEAVYRVGLTDNPKVGSFEGAISLLTKGKVSRTDYSKQAVVMALMHLQNPSLY